MSARAREDPALNIEVPSGNEVMMVGKIKLVIFEVDKVVKQLEILFMAACLTSASLSFNNKVKVWIRLLSVISGPKDSANCEKFLAKHKRTFHDLSSPAARSVPRV